MAKRSTKDIISKQHPAEIPKAPRPLLLISPHSSRIQQRPRLQALSSDLFSELLVVSNLREYISGPYQDSDPALALIGFDSEPSRATNEDPIAELSATLSYFAQTPTLVFTRNYDRDLSKKIISLGAQDWLSEADLSSPRLDQVLHLAIERKNLELAAQAQWQAKEASYLQLQGRIAHDLRDHLGSIIGFSEYLQSQNHQLPASLQDPPQRILRAGRRMLHFLDEIAALARLSSSDERQALFHSFDAREILSEVLESLHFKIEAQAAEFEIEEWPHQLFGHPLQISELLLNLLSNALKYAKPDQVCRIQVRGFLLANYQEIQIEDQGQGIPADRLENIFQAFFQEKGSLSSKGVGLGLSIVKKIVEDHRGELYVESQEGRGTLFRIRLPYENQQSAQRRGA